MDYMKDPGTGKPAHPAGVINKIKEQIASLFRPEEVEVTFRMEGNRWTYTYIKVEEKSVASI